MNEIIRSQEQYLIHFQRHRELFIKVSILNKNGIKVNEVEGIVLDGSSINIRNTGSVRRTANISMIVKDNTFLLGEDKKIWIDKKVKIEIGIKSLKTDEIIWFNKGHFEINNPSLKYDVTSKILEFEGLDYMCKQDGTLGGTLTFNAKIGVGLDISSSIQATAKDLGLINSYNIERINKTIPYDIEKKAGDSVYSLLEELQNLYMDWELFFDENGTLIYQKIKNRNNDMVVLDFEEDDSNLITSYNINYDLQNVRNKVVIWGYTDDKTGTQVNAEVINNDINSPFSIDKIGARPLVISDDKIYTNEQAQLRAEYELFHHTNMNDKVTISCVPFYFLDVNKLVSFNIQSIELSGKFLIDEISFPLGLGQMTFTAHRIYE